MATGHELYVSHIESDGNFLKIWGQRDKDAVATVERLLLNLSEEFDCGKYMADPQYLAPDSLVACRFQDGRYYRSKIIDVNLPTGMITCHYLDYGNRATVPFSNLRVPKNHLTSLFRSPAQATSYILTGVVGSWSPQSLASISEDILYEELKCVVVKSVGQHSEIHLLKLFVQNHDYAENLCRKGIACPIPQNEFEVMIWTQLGFPKPAPVTVPSYQYQMFNPLSMSQQWAPICIAQPVPTISTWTVANGLNSSILPVTSLSGNTSSLCGSVTNVPGSITNGPKPAKKTNTGRERPASLQEMRDYKVFISHVDEDSFAFYVQLEENKDELDEMVAQLNDPSQDFENLKQPYTPGTWCLAKYSEDNAIYRSIITSIEEDCLNVYFLDYGNVDTVKCIDLFEMPPHFTQQKAMAIPFCLSGFTKGGMSDDVKHLTKAFRDLVLEENCVLRVVPPKCKEQLTTKQWGELFIQETNVKELINVEILQKNQKPKSVIFRNAPFPEANSKVKVKVAYVKSMGRFFVQLSTTSADLQAVMDIVDKHCKGPARMLTDGEIQPGVPCCALFDQEWYRAMIMDTDPMLKVIFVDYGNEEVTEASDLREATDEIVNKLVAQAIPCRLAEAKVDESLTAKFEDLVLEKELTMHVLAIDEKDPCVVVKLFNNEGDISDLLLPEDQVNSAPPVSSQNHEARQSASAVSTQNHDARMHSGNFRTDPQTWGVGNGNRRGSSIGHCDRVNNSYAEPECEPRRNTTSHSNSRNRMDSQPSVNHNVDTWEDSSTPVSIPKWSVVIGSKIPVSVVYTNNPCDFYIHESGADSDNLQDLIEAHYSGGGKVLPSSLRTEGSVCIAKFSEDDCYYRAIILKPGDLKTEVEFIDYGNLDMVDNNNLFVINENMVSQKAKAVHCQLIGVPHVGKWTAEDIQKFESVTESEQLEAEVIEMNGNLYSVILRGSPLSQSTINECFGATPETMLTKTSIVTSIQEQQPLDIGSDHAVEVTSFETPGRFYIKKQSPTFDEMMVNMQKVYKNAKPLEKPFIGQKVVALFKNDGGLYRGEVKVDKGGKFGIQYIDYGNKALVDPTNIYGLQYQFSTLPAQAILCELGGVKPMDGQWQKDVEVSKLFRGQVTCSVLKNGELSTVVKLTQNGQDLALQLISLGLAAEPYVPMKNLPPVEAEMPMKNQPPVEAVNVTTPLEPTYVPGVNPQMMIGQFVQAVILSLDNHSLYVTFEPRVLSKMKNDVANCVAQGLAKLPPHKVAPGTLCLVKHNSLDYNRAVIVDSKSISGVAVKLLDSGCSEEIPSHNMFLLPNEIACIPALGYECLVNNTEVKNLQPFTGQKITIFVENFEHDRFSGQVLDESGRPLSFAPVQPVCTPPPILPMAILNQEIVVDVVHASGNCVWLHQAKDSAVLSQLLDNLYTTFEEGGDSLTVFASGTLCAALSEDGNWYRAVVESKSGDHARVQFLDYGNSEDVPLNNLKVLKNFRNIPSLAVKAVLPIISEDEDMGQTILEMAGDKSFIAYFSRKGMQWLVELLDGKDIFSLNLIRTGRALSISNNPFPALMSKPQVSLQVGQSFSATLSFANSLSDFYVHLSSRSEELQKVESDLKSMAHCMKNVENWPSVGSRVMALYAEDGIWYRGEVLPDLSILFIDYGNVDKVELKSLKVLPPALEDIENLAVKCSLQAPPQKKWSEQALDDFVQLVESGPFTIHVQAVAGSTYLVDVVDCTEASVGDKLAANGFLEDSPCASNNKLNISLQVGQSSSATLSFANSLSDFYVHLSNRSEELQKVERDLKSMAHCMENVENWPSVGSRVMALYAEDGVWYRGEVLPDLSILFIDYGNVDKVELKSLKVLPPALEDIENLAVKCSLQAPPQKKWSEQALDDFVQLVESGPFTIHVQAVAGSTYLVDVVDCTEASVGDKLAANGFLEDSLCASDDILNVCSDVHETEIEATKSAMHEAEIVFSNSPLDFYVQLNRDAGLIATITEELEKADEYPDCEDFSEGKICAALYSDNVWYRAQIIGRQEDQSYVKFIDFGNTFLASQLKELPKNLLTIPPLAIHCSLKSCNQSSFKTFENLVDSESNFQIELLSQEQPATVNLWLEGENVLHRLISDLKELDNSCDSKTCMIQEELLTSSNPGQQPTQSNALPDVGKSNCHGLEICPAPDVIASTVSEEPLLGSNLVLAQEESIKLTDIGPSGGDVLENYLSDQTSTEPDIILSTVSEDHPLDSENGAAHEESISLLVTNGDILESHLPDQTYTEPDIILLHDEPKDPAHLGNGGSLLDPSNDDVEIISVGKGDDSIIDITSSEEEIPVITLNDTVDDIICDEINISVDVEETSEDKNDSVPEVNTSGEEAGVKMIPRGGKTCPALLEAVEDNEPPCKPHFLTCAETSETLSYVDDSVSIIEYQMIPSAVLDAEFGIPDSSTVDSEGSQQTRNLENIHSDMTKILVSSELISSENLSHAEKAMEVQENCANTKEDEVPPTVSSSTENNVQLSGYVTSETDALELVSECYVFDPNCKVKVNTADKESETSGESCVNSCSNDEGKTEHIIERHTVISESADCLIHTVQNSSDEEVKDLVRLPSISHGNNVSEEAGANTCNISNNEALKLIDSEELLNHAEGEENKVDESTCSVLNILNPENITSEVINRSQIAATEKTESITTFNGDGTEGGQSIDNKIDVSATTPAQSDKCESFKLDNESLVSEDCFLSNQHPPQFEDCNSDPKTNESTFDKDSEVVVTLSTYPDWKSCESNINETSHGQSLARAKDFESDLVQAIPGYRTFAFEECEHHQLTVEIMTSPL